ncbi:MAG: hypothetical protein M1812_005931 [Candelaria pacifica]|nr:MAG: hypothetical protein M1812_005931 [Candelaria pacifica]
MKFTTQSLAVLAIGFLNTNQVLAGCGPGKYSVKGEAFGSPDCKGGVDGASIANYGTTGPCINIRGDVSLAAHNDGCGSSHPDFEFFDGPQCTGKKQTIKKQGGGECFVKPGDAVSVRVVSN